MIKPEWIVNDLGELGVMVDGRAHFLYKGKSLSYASGRHDDGSPRFYRPVGKREFGEVCHPFDWWPRCAACNRASPKHKDGYTEGVGWKHLPADPGVDRAECLDLLGSMADRWPDECDAGAMDALAGILRVRLLEQDGRMRMDPATLPEAYVDPYAGGEG